MKTDYKKSAESLMPKRCIACNCTELEMGYVFQGAFMYGEISLMNNIRNMFNSNKLVPIFAFKCIECSFLMTFAAR